MRGGSSGKGLYRWSRVARLPPISRRRPYLGNWNTLTKHCRGDLGGDTDRVGEEAAGDDEISEKSCACSDYAARPFTQVTEADKTVPENVTTRVDITNTIFSDVKEKVDEDDENASAGSPAQNAVGPDECQSCTALNCVT